MVRVASKLMASAALALVAGLAGAQTSVTVEGRVIEVTVSPEGQARIAVDGFTFHRAGVIYLDPDPMVVGGMTVLTGSSGAGGNACNAAPFVISLPKDAPPSFWGPVSSCADMEPVAEGDRLVWRADALPGVPGESWTWDAANGFQMGPEVLFLANEGWDGIARLDGAHPAEALRINAVALSLYEGLGDDYSDFAGRLTDLGSGDLTAEGYLGQACLKFTCEADWALLYLHPATEGVFAAWRVAGDSEPKLWPAETTLWPAEAMAALRAAVGQ